jgi:hypothetical protein
MDRALERGYLDFRALERGYLDFKAMERGYLDFRSLEPGYLDFGAMKRGYFDFRLFLFGSHLVPYVLICRKRQNYYRERLPNSRKNHRA